MNSITLVEGIGPAYANKLRAAGIGTCQKLLDRGATPRGRKEIVERTGIPDKAVRQWVNQVDLYRVRGVRQQYARLLEEAGVDTVPGLAKRNPENLYHKMVAINEERQIVHQVPTRAKVADWIEQARHLPRVVTY